MRPLARSGRPGVFPPRPSGANRSSPWGAEGAAHPPRGCRARALLPVIHHVGSDTAIEFIDEHAEAVKPPAGPPWHPPPAPPATVSVTSSPAWFSDSLGDLAHELSARGSTGLNWRNDRAIRELATLNLKGEKQPRVLGRHVFTSSLLGPSVRALQCASCSLFGFFIFKR